MTEVKLTYFKGNGKYYTEGTIGYPDNVGFYYIVEDIRKLIRRGCLSGLVEGASEFHVLAVIRELPHLFPIYGIKENT